MLARLLFVSIFLVAQGVSPTSQKDDLVVLNDAFSTLKSKPIELSLEKTLKLSLLDRESKESGKLWLKPERLRIELNGEGKSLFVFDGKNFWVQQNKPKDLGAGTLVSKIDGLSLKTNSLFRLFLTKEKISVTFKLVKKTVQKKETEFLLEPLNQKDFPDAVKLMVSLCNKNNGILRMVYWDELENETSYKFSEKKTVKSIPNSKFAYAPPKDAEVSEL